MLPATSPITLPNVAASGVIAILTGEASKLLDIVGLTRLGC